MDSRKIALWIGGAALFLTGAIMAINYAITKNGGTNTIPNPLVSIANRARLALKKPAPTK